MNTAGCNQAKPEEGGDGKNDPGKCQCAELRSRVEALEVVLRRVQAVSTSIRIVRF